MFGKVFAGVATAGVLAGVLATGAMAATPSAAPSASPTQKQRPALKDAFAGTVTAVNATQLTIKNAKAGSKTFFSTDKTVVIIDGRTARWSEIVINIHVAVRYETRDGKLYLKRVHVGRSRLAGNVQSVNGNVITIRTRDGKDVKLTVNASTKYFQVTGKKQRQPGSLTDIKTGTRLLAAGSYDASHNFDAALIAYRNK